MKIKFIPISEDSQKLYFNNLSHLHKTILKNAKSYRKDHSKRNKLALLIDKLFNSKRLNGVPSVDMAFNNLVLAFAEDLQEEIESFYGVGILDDNWEFDKE